MPKVPVAPAASTRIGKTNEMGRYVVQSTKTAMPIANPRMAIGKISDSSNQTQVPMKHCTKATNSIIAARMM